MEGIVKLPPKQITEYEGRRKIGFQIEEHGVWLNSYGEDEKLKNEMKILERGNKVSFDVDDHNDISNLKLMEGAISKPESTSDMIKISGKDYMLYVGLLKKAHEKKERFSMEITDSWVGEDMKMAWCKVRLTAFDDKGERIFDGFGSSSPANATTIGSTHPVEMAHTRAKGRALRDYLNIGEVIAEELAKA